MTESVYVQLTPIPYGLRPPSPLEQLALAADGQKDKLTLFLEGEKAAFEAWQPDIPPKRMSFSIVNGSDTRFALFVGQQPARDDFSPKAEAASALLSCIYTGAVYGDVGTELHGVSFDSRGRWTIDDDFVRTTTSVEGEAPPAARTIADWQERADRLLRVLEVVCLGIAPALVGIAYLLWRLAQ